MPTLATPPPETYPEVRLRRLTAEEYHTMAEAGILGEDDRVELLGGTLIAMSPIGDPHIRCVNRLTRLLVTRTSEDLAVSVQNPVRLGPHDEPEPDVVVTTALGGAPRPDEVLLLIEVADATLAYDRDIKLPRYAAAGIPEVWIVDLAGVQVEVHREPREAVYRSRRLAGPGDMLAIAALPDVAPVPVDALLDAHG